jgi:ketosteroid isomerase-like protein
MSADRAIFDRAWAAFAEGRPGDLAPLLDPQVEWHSAPLGSVFRGAEQLERWSQTLLRTWKSLTVVLAEVDDTVDGVVAAYGTVTAFGHGGDRAYDGDMACVTEYAGGRLVRGHVFASHEEARDYVVSRSASRALAA